MSSKKNKLRESRPRAKICLKSNTVRENVSLHKSNPHRSCSNPRPTVGLFRSKSSTEEQLGLHMKPSPELLAYYKEKIKQYKNENDDMLETIDQCKSLCDSSFQLDQELQKRNCEISSLQQAVSDLQVYLYQEREQVLRLYAENDKLKLREVEDRKKIDLLLTLSGTSEKELTYFMCESQSSISVPQKLPPRLKRFRDRLNVGNESGDHPGRKSEYKSAQSSSAAVDAELLNLKTQSLAAQLEEQTRLYKDQIECLLKDRDLCQQEREVERTRLQAQISSVSTKLQEVQDKLCSTMHDFVQLREEHRNEEMSWLGEKTQITRNLECCQEQIGEHYPNVPGYALSGSGTSLKVKQNSCDVMLLKEELRQRDNLVAMYQDQCVALEAEMTNLRAQTVASKNMFKERTQKLAGQVTYLKSKYDDLDRRRILEAEGFRNDIKILRNRLMSLEKKISRTMSSSSQVSLASEREQQQLYSTAKETMNKARQLEHELRNIKNKVLDIEQDLHDSGIFK